LEFEAKMKAAKDAGNEEGKDPKKAKKQVKINDNKNDLLT
jgi:hypothetical protein